MGAARPTGREVWLGEPARDHVASPRTASAGSGDCVVVVRRSPERAGEEACEDVAGLVRWGGQAAVLLVADGLGGHRDGAVAARLTLDAVMSRLADVGWEPEIVRSAIVDGIERANAALLERPGGAATTILAAMIDGDHFRSIHAGDSELLVTGQRGRIRHHTVSHSPVGYGVEAGLIASGDSLEHEERHVISSFVGMAGVRIELASAIQLAARDTVVLASDGLWDNLTIEEVTEIVRKGPLDRAAQVLVDRCGARMADSLAGNGPGKPDDLTILLYRSRSKSPDSKRPSSQTPAAKKIVRSPAKSG